MNCSRALAAFPVPVTGPRRPVHRRRKPSASVHLGKKRKFRNLRWKIGVVLRKIKLKWLMLKYMKALNRIKRHYVGLIDDLVAKNAGLGKGTTELIDDGFDRRKRFLLPMAASNSFHFYR